MVAFVFLLIIALSSAAFVAATIYYGKMLETAFTPFYLASPVGDFILWTLFMISTILRKLFPKVVEQGAMKLARAKADSLCPDQNLKGIVFIGSSTFTYWRLIQQDFSCLGVPIVNSAFGGSCTMELLPFVDELAVSFEPKVVVYFCGTNNIAQGLSVQSVLEGFRLFMAKLHGKCPNTHVIYLGITCTPFYRKWNVNGAIGKVVEANKIMKLFCDGYPSSCDGRPCGRVTYVHTDQAGEKSDISAFVKDASFFLGDLHHLTDEGHQCLASNILLPAIKEALR